MRILVSQLTGRGLILVPVLLALAASPKASESGSSHDDEEDPGRQHSHGHIEEVIVHAHPLGGDVSQSTAILAGEELEHAARQTIGETLGQTAGVHSASFGPAVGHPVIHGLSGTRVLVLENHVASMDVSSTGADHGIAVEPFLADRIEVIKGSGALLYGSGAMGGTVDVHTERVPSHVPERGFAGRALLRGDSASDTRYGGFRLDAGGGQWAWHLDGYASSNGDLSIPGYAAMDQYEEEHHEEEGEEDHEEEAPVNGVLENSFGDYSGAAFGGSFIGDVGHFGVAVVLRDWTYGIVGEHVHGAEEHHDEEEGEHHDEEADGHEEEHTDEASPWIDLEQVKIMSEFGVHDPLPGFASLEGSLAVSDYEHVEMEAEGVVGTRFVKDAWDGRVVLESEQTDPWKAALGVQFGRGELRVSGEEGEVEPIRTDHRAVFGVAQAEYGGVHLETGARLESVEHVFHDGQSREFLATSFSLGVMVPVGPWELTARLDRSMRAPSGEELATSNVHLAIGGFEMGSLDLDEEEAVNLSVAARYRSEKLRITLEAYRYAFDSFIYQRETTDDHGGLPVFQWSQTEATFMGFDAEARAELVTAAEHTVDLIARYDWVATDVDDPHESHLPRIPPQRVSVAAEFTWKAFWGRAAYSRFCDQDEVTSYETPTDGYGNLDLEGEYATYLGGADLILFVAGRNLGDEEQRQHTSFVKEEAPLAGRRVEAGVRILF